MGIYNRDYYRNDPRQVQSSSWLTTGCKWLILINVVVFVAQGLIFRQINGFGRVPVILEWFELDPSAVMHGQVWRLLTYAFCHHDLLHILFNMLFLGMFGMTLERMSGTREFVLFYLAAAVISGAGFLLMQLALGQGQPSIGASGAVMGVLAWYATRFPREDVYMWGIVRIPIWVLFVFYVIYDLRPVLGAFLPDVELFGGSPQDGIAHSAHLGGLAFGFVYQRLGWRLESFWDRFERARPTVIRRERSRAPVQIYNPPEEESAEVLERKVDAVLAKIAAQGEASLTDQERDILRRASERYKGNQSHR